MNGTPFNLTPRQIRSRFSELHNLADVADLLGIPPHQLAFVLYRAPHRYPYRTFQIRKKSGNSRTISSPPVSLKRLQEGLNHVLSHIYTPRPNVMGFVRGRNIVDNAIAHAGKRWVLNIDLENFFPSINFGRVRGVLMAKPYSLTPKAATVIANICCVDNQLPQGAPTSPVLSNMICSRLDSELLRLAKHHGCTYTRYADDLTFSTNAPLFPVELAIALDGDTGEKVALGNSISALINSNGFHSNAAKTRLQFRRNRQEVTGLKVNRFPNVPRHYVKQLGAMLHAWEVHELPAAAEEHYARYSDRHAERWPGKEPPNFKHVIRGKLEFIRMVKDEADPVFRRLANRLNRLEPGLIKAYPPSISQDPDQRWISILRQYRSLIFRLVVERGGDQSSGTAFSWGARFLATAAHNVDGGVSVSPPMPDHYVFRQEDIFVDPVRGAEVDCALLRITTPLRNIGHWPIRTAPIEPGELVAVLAFPSIPFHELADVGVFEGRVESTAARYNDIRAFQISAPISGGMSGAPVVDRIGQLMGIVSESTFESVAGGVPGRSFGHVVPIDYLQSLSKDIL